MWWIIFFMVGMIAFIVFSYDNNLHKHKGVRFKDRTQYTLGLSIFFMILFAWLAGGDLQKIGKGFLFGIPLSFLLFGISKHWLDKKVENQKVLYSKKDKKTFIWFVSIIIAQQIIFSFYSAESLIKSTALLTFAFAWLLSEIFMLAYVISLEKKIGGYLFEDER